MRTRTVVLLLVALGFGTTTYADVVTDWNTAALNAIRRGKTPPPVASRALAILHASIYDAVNGISRTHEPYRVPSTVPGSASKEAAAAAAAHQVLVALFPGDAGTFDALYAATLATVPDGPHRKAGVSWGESVAAAILVWRSTDNSDAMVAPPASGDPGAWQPTPPAFAPYLLPQWAFVEPFSMPTSSFGRPAGPAGGNEWQVHRRLQRGQSSGRSCRIGPDIRPGHDRPVLGGRSGHRNTARALEHDRAGARGPFRQYHRPERTPLCAAEHCDGGRRHLRLGREVYFHNWRPVTAIRNGDSDGNGATAADAGWTSFIVTPPISGLCLRPQHVQWGCGHRARDVPTVPTTSHSRPYRTSCPALPAVLPASLPQPMRPRSAGCMAASTSGFPTRTG